MHLLWQLNYQKNGIRNGKQKYKCHSCGVQFLGGILINPKNIWEEYTQGKQTYKQLANKYNCSKRTIQKKDRSTQLGYSYKTSKECHCFNGYHILGAKNRRNVI